MSTYLIDFENVKSSGLNGIDRIKEGDSVQLFWSKRENKITIEMMEMIRKSPCEIVMHKAETGERDALDHQLCSYLGYLAGATGETSFVIVSNDKAYDYLIDFWKKLNPVILIRRFPEIINAVENEKPADVVSEKVVLATEVEMVSGESKGGRNNRRRDRDRNGKYLKNGGRNGRRGDRVAEVAEAKTEVVETEVETAEAKVETVEAEVVESSGNPTLDAIVNAAFSAIEVRKASKEAEKTAETSVEVVAEETEVSEPVAEEAVVEEAKVEEVKVEEVKRPVVKLPVVGNITSSVVHNTGSRADGIMTGYQPKESVVTKVSEEKAEYKAEETKVEEADTVEETVPEAPVEEAVEAKEAVEAVEESQPVQEVTEVASEAVEEAVEAVTEAVVEEVVAEEATTEESVVAEVETTEAEEKPEKPKRRKRTPRKKKSEEVEVTEIAAPAEPEEDKTEAESDKPVKADKRRGRPVKSKAEEKKAEKKPVTKEDVVQRIEDAKDADWTEDVVNLINSASDKKELYASIVKRLGQEQGRPVYHAIKSLK